MDPLEEPFLGKQARSCQGVASQNGLQGLDRPALTCLDVACTVEQAVTTAVHFRFEDEIIEPRALGQPAGQGQVDRVGQRRIVVAGFKHPHN